MIRDSGSVKLYWALGSGLAVSEGWPAAARARVAPLLAEYRGRAAPLAWNRHPDPHRLAA